MPTQSERNKLAFLEFKEKLQAQIFERDKKLAIQQLVEERQLTYGQFKLDSVQLLNDARVDQNNPLIKKEIRKFKVNQWFKGLFNAEMQTGEQLAERDSRVLSLATPLYRRND